MPPGVAIRPARRDELDALATIELDANESLIAAGVPFPDGPTATPRHLIEGSLAEGLLFVAAGTDDMPVGFIACHARDADLYLGELDVARTAQGRGIGRALVLHALSAARARGLGGATLTTDRLVPFNAPFYASLGFREVPRGAGPAALDATRDAEEAAGRDMARRTGMVLRFVTP